MNYLFDPSAILPQLDVRPVEMSLEEFYKLTDEVFKKAK